MARKKKRIIYPVIFMIIVTVVFTLALALINEFTKDKIAYNNEIKIKKTLLYVFDIDAENNDNESISNTYDALIEEATVNDQHVYIAKKSNEVIGYAFEVQGNGLWGTISGYAAVTPDYRQLIGIDFVAHSETPGLGGRISDSKYKEQFRDIGLDSENGNYIIHRPNQGGNIDAIAGATKTAESVRKLLNEDIHDFIQAAGGDK